jgi:hypothetical protein
MNVYLDIDGVLLVNGQPSFYVYDFLKYITDSFSVYWLTTHCRGDCKITMTYLSQYFDQLTLKLLKKIKPTNWSLSKTEAIDFTTPFLWFDDYIFDFEKQDLLKHDVLNNWIKIDLVNNPDQLKYLLSNLAQLT